MPLSRAFFIFVPFFPKECLDGIPAALQFTTPFYCRVRPLQSLQGCVITTSECVAPAVPRDNYICTSEQVRAHRLLFS